LDETKASVRSSDGSVWPRQGASLLEITRDQLTFKINKLEKDELDKKHQQQSKQ
jgi:hypothetical protein